MIICAQNEDENLKKNLPLFLEQDYNNYEVILVNDQSIDSTKYVLKEFEKKYNNLKVVNIDKHINKYTTNVKNVRTSIMKETEKGKTNHTAQIEKVNAL